jgi:hypothetical protein
MPQRRDLCFCRNCSFKFIIQQAEARYADVALELSEPKITVYELVVFLQGGSGLKRKEQEDAAIIRLLRGYKAIHRHTFVRDVNMIC